MGDLVNRPGLGDTLRPSDRMERGGACGFWRVHHPMLEHSRAWYERRSVWGIVNDNLVWRII